MALVLRFILALVLAGCIAHSAPAAARGHAAGRLVRVQSPYPDAATSTGHVRSERLYYDGVRRIQEVVIDPMTTIEGIGGDPGLQAMLQQGSPEAAAGDPESAPVGFEQLMLGDPTPGGPALVVYLSREYIWGPGDVGLDELLVQYDYGRAAAWAIHDASGDLVAICDTGGANGRARVVGQWTFDAYGACLSYDQLHPHSPVHLGHKGLFVDRLDAGVVDGWGGAELPRVVPDGHVIYYNRNRTYAPALGRFLQKDPNATAMALLAGSHSGRGIVAIVAAFGMDDMYGDGANLYEYLGSSPWMRSDPLGLSWDPFDVVDEYVAETVGAGAALFAALGQGARATAVLAAHIATYLPFPAASLAGELALVALGEQDVQTALIAGGMGLIPGGKLLGPAFKGIGSFVGRAASAAWGGAKHYAGKAAKFLWRKSPFGLMHRAAAWLAKGCGCFEQGTEVWTAHGRAPIDGLTEGDEVFAQDEVTGEVSLRRVVRTMVRKAAPIVAVTFMASSGPATLNTTEEHPFLVWRDGGGAWVQAACLRPGELVRAESGEAVMVASIHFTGRRATVYNLEVEGLHNYRVGRDGVVVHNGDDCLLWLKALRNRGARIFNHDAWYDEVERNLVKHHGGNPHRLSNAIHKIKHGEGFGGAKNVYLDLTGNVYHPDTGQLLGNLLTF